MLPDYPDIKIRARDLLYKSAIRQGFNKDPLLSQMSTSILHEGSSINIHNEDAGTEDDIIMKKSENTFSIDLRKLKDMSIADVFSLLSKSGQAIADDQSMNAIAKLDEVVRSVGNVTDGGGEPFSPELFMEAFRKIWIDFDEDDKPIFPQLVIGPALWDRAIEVMKQLDEDPYKDQFAELIEEKRREFYDRESARKLVD